MSRAAVAALVVGALAGCHGPRGAAPTLDHGATTAPGPAASGCPGPGVTVAIDLDGDGRDDRVRIAPTLAAATCLEIHATTAPPLRCRAGDGDPIARLELAADGRPSDPPAIACDPAGARVAVIRPTPPPPVTDDHHIATGRTFAGVIVASVAPSATGLWLEGGDDFAAIVWRGGWHWLGGA